MKVLLHIPHSSLKVPKYFYHGLCISKKDFIRYNLEMTDMGVDYLFKDVKGKKFKAKYSRLFCDVERFRNDEDEIMSKLGEGVIYTHLYDGTRFHEHDEKYRKRVLKYYDAYHRKLDKITKRLLKNDETLLIIDCHSFSDKMASHFFKPPFKDICIGIEKDYYNQEIIDTIIKEIEKRNYSYEINYPYKGCLIPNYIMNHRYKGKGKIICVMLEINKRIYL